MSYTIVVTIPPMALTYVNVSEPEAADLLAHWKGRAACYGRRQV